MGLYDDLNDVNIEYAIYICSEFRKVKLKVEKELNSRSNRLRFLLNEDNDFIENCISVISDTESLLNSKSIQEFASLDSEEVDNIGQKVGKAIGYLNYWLDKLEELDS